MSEPAEPKKRRGRPPKNPEGAKGGNLTFRVRDGMRERLEASAKARGLSISEDVEKRIERTFDYDYLIGESETAFVMRTIGSAIRRFEASSGKQWTADDATQEAAYEAVRAILDVIMKPRSFVKEGLEFHLTDEAYMRRGLQNAAMDSAMHELRNYLNLKNMEYIELRPAYPSQTGVGSGLK